MTATKLGLKNRLRRGFTMMEVIVAMAIIGFMIALAVTASVIGLKGQSNAQNRIMASSAAGEMYAAFSRTYYDDGFYSGVTYTTEDERAAAFLNAYNGEIAAGLNLDFTNTTFSVSGGTITESAIEMDKITYYQDSDTTSGTAVETTCVTRGITFESSAAYKFVYTYYVNSLDFDEDDFTYTKSRAFTVTAEIDLSSGYGVTVTAKTNDSSKNVFEEVYSFA